MITALKIVFEHNDELKPHSSLASVFHGVLMENIDPQYADILHTSQLHPYSQYITGEDGCVVWNINALDKRSDEEIIGALNSVSFDKAELTGKGLSLRVLSKECYNTSYDGLLKKHYLEERPGRYITVRFITPTAFKSAGKYVIFPTSDLILNSLVKRFDSFSGDSNISDELLFDYIERQTDIVGYDLKSAKFSLEGITIPSFIGTAKLRFSGSREFIRLMNMLMRFGEYSGTGIKTSLGMGAYKIIHTGGIIE